MNTLKSALVVASAVLMSCENPIRMETIVHEDGSLDKTIVLKKMDSIGILYNYFGVNEAKGWAMTAEEYQAGSTDKGKYKLQFNKSFPSAEAMNKELDIASDTLFRIHSSFQKNFRWFYTYIRYSETFRPIDRLKMVKADDYFNQEDRAFINRLPGESTAISKADSLFLQQLNEKIYDQYANQGLLNEQFALFTEVIKKNTSNNNWIDTLNRKKDFIYRKLKDMEDDSLFVIKLAEILHIPIPREKAMNDFNRLVKDVKSRVGFMAFARDGKYENIIEMPWPVVHSNADSVAGNKLYWKPLATKFAIQEYEMFAVVRKINIWAIVTSVGIITATFIAFKRKRSNIQNSHDSEHP